jgi:ATP synthase protein I
MTPDPSRRRSPRLPDQIATKVHRKLLAQRRKHSIWYGFGMFGLVGWSVAIPALLGIALGMWIDRQITSPYSWTLMGVVLGVAAGCFNAWYWIQHESRDPQSLSGEEQPPVTRPTTTRQKQENSHGRNGMDRWTNLD